jgi:hypothetical protein
LIRYYICLNQQKFITIPKGGLVATSHSTINIRQLWESKDETLWKQALDGYWNIDSARRNRELEERLEMPGLVDRIRGMDEQEWFEFLHDEYFRWKFTSPRDYAMTSKLLCENRLYVLDNVRKRLIEIRPEDARRGLETAIQIRGLAVIGASGLLSLMYPTWYGTVDKFMILALHQLKVLPEWSRISSLTKVSKKDGKLEVKELRLDDGVFLVEMLRKKATQLNKCFNTGEWTPRKIDKILWASRQN